MPGTAADHQGHLPGGDFGGADDAAVDAGHIAAVGRNEAVQCLIREVSGIVEDLGHGSSLNPCWRTNAVGRELGWCGRPPSGLTAAPRAGVGARSAPGQALSSEAGFRRRGQTLASAVAAGSCRPWATWLVPRA